MKEVKKIESGIWLSPDTLTDAERDSVLEQFYFEAEMAEMDSAEEIVKHIYYKGDTETWCDGIHYIPEPIERS